MSLTIPHWFRKGTSVDNREDRASKGSLEVALPDAFSTEIILSAWSHQILHDILQKSSYHFRSSISGRTSQETHTGRIWGLTRRASPSSPSSFPAQQLSPRGPYGGGPIGGGPRAQAHPRPRSELLPRPPKPQQQRREWIGAPSRTARTANGASWSQTAHTPGIPNHGGGGPARSALGVMHVVDEHPSTRVAVAICLIADRSHTHVPRATAQIQRCPVGRKNWED